MITAGWTPERRGSEAARGKKQRRGHANIDKYFIPQHTDSVRPGPRMRAGRGRKERLGKKNDEKQRG